MTPPEAAPQPEAFELTLEQLVYEIMRNFWAGGNILRGELPKIPTVEALPAAVAEYRHRIVIVPGGAGVADVVYVCRKTAADTYAWVDVSTPYAATTGISTSDLKDNMVANGLVADGGATPLNLDGGALTCNAISAGALTCTGFQHSMGYITFWGGTGFSSKPVITGSKGGNAALASLLSALATYGLVADSTS